MNDFSTIGDTALWRLTVYITPESIRAWLKNTGAPNEPARLMMEAQWNPNEGGVLDKIEGAVYDNPSVLGDFECDVIVDTPDLLLMPEALLDDEEGESNIPAVYNQVFNAEEGDIMTDTLPGGVVAMYTMTKGLLPFLNRTFPGARVSSAMTVQAKNCLQYEVNGGCLAAAHITEGRVDIVIIRNGEIMSIASHSWHAPADVAYHILNMSEIADPSRKSLEVKLTGLKSVRDEILPLFERFSIYAEFATLPGVADFDTMPLAAALCANRKSRL